MLGIALVAKIIYNSKKKLLQRVICMDEPWFTCPVPAPHRHDTFLADGQTLVTVRNTKHGKALLGESESVTLDLCCRETVTCAIRSSPGPALMRCVSRLRGSEACTVESGSEWHRRDHRWEHRIMLLVGFGVCLCSHHSCHFVLASGARCSGRLLGDAHAVLVLQYTLGGFFRTVHSTMIPLPVHLQAGELQPAAATIERHRQYD
jgi:hypothetical protein